MEFLAQVLDEFTHLGRFSKPVYPSLIQLVCVARDAFVPRDKVSNSAICLYKKAEFVFFASFL